MKKTIIIALTLILILASFISCENNTHEHTWDKGTVTKAATCTEKGVKTYTCTVCKETKTEDIAINTENHTWDEGVVTTAATCTEAGEETFKCTGCKETTTEPIKALGHDLHEKIAKEPGYVNKGLKVKKCSRCDYISENQTIDPKSLSGIWLKTDVKIGEKSLNAYLVISDTATNGKILFGHQDPAPVQGTEPHAEYYDLSYQGSNFSIKISDENPVKITITEESNGQGSGPTVNNENLEVVEEVINNQTIITIKELTFWSNTSDWTFTVVPSHDFEKKTDGSNVICTNINDEKVHAKGIICTEEHEDKSPRFILVEKALHSIENGTCKECGYKEQ